MKRIRTEIKRNYLLFSFCLLFFVLFNILLTGSFIDRYGSYLEDYQAINDIAISYNDSKSSFLLYTREHKEENRVEYERAGAQIFANLERVRDKMQQDRDCMMMYRIVSQMLEHRQELLWQHYQYGRVSINEIDTLNLQIERNLNLLTTDYLEYVTGSFSVYSSRLRIWLLAGNGFLVLLTFTAFFVNTSIYRNLLDAIQKLTVGAEEISHQLFDARDIEDASYVEINFVIRTFNDMKHHIRDMIAEINRNHEIRERLAEQMLENETQKRRLAESQMQKLQMQINPHFLFNTLSLVIRSIQIGERDIPVQLIKSISQILRRSIEIRSDSIPVDEEIELLETYLYIQRIHCKGRIRIQLDVRKSYMDDETRVPPLILQPLVENAIQHGLKNVVEGGLVQISITEKAAFLLVQIRDNGCGIRPEVLENLRNHVPMKRIGLGNVWERLRLFYHRDDAMEIESSDEGTVITLYLFKNPPEENSSRGMGTVTPGETPASGGVPGSRPAPGGSPATPWEITEEEHHAACNDR